MKMNIQTAKLELIQWLSTIDNPQIIEKILAIRSDEKADWWNNLSTDEQKSIETGISDAKVGKLHSHAEARKAYGKWL
jgi:hypothetical protein